MNAPQSGLYCGGEVQRVEQLQARLVSPKFGGKLTHA
jgi:hypothetical protein